MKQIHSFEPLFGNWYIDELLGEGSFGKVYSAYRDTIGEREHAAIKHISIPKSKADYENLKYELNTTNESYLQTYLENQKNQVLEEYRLQIKFKGFTNFVDCQDIEVLPKRDDEVQGYDIFIRMEKLDNLARAFVGRRMNAQETAKLGVDVCKALELLKNENLVHRDLKPQNIFVSKNGDYKVGDFGTARSLPSGSVMMSVAGTSGFMAPEIARGEPSGFSADIYSLGMILYRQINGRAPFVDAENSTDTTQAARAEIKRLTGEPVPDIESIPEELNRIIKKACEFDKQKRYQSAKEMSEDLEAFLGFHRTDVQKEKKNEEPPKETVSPKPQQEKESFRPSGINSAISWERQKVQRDDWGSSQNQESFDWDWDASQSNDASDSEWNVMQSGSGKKHEQKKRKLNISGLLAAVLCVIVIGVITYMLLKPKQATTDPKNISECSVAITSVGYSMDGETLTTAQNVTIQVTDDGASVDDANYDYSLTGFSTNPYKDYDESKGQYTFTITVTGKGNYTGEKAFTCYWPCGRKKCPKCQYYNSSDASYCGHCQREY